MRFGWKASEEILLDIHSLWKIRLQKLRRQDVQFNLLVVTALYKMQKSLHKQHWWHIHPDARLLVGAYARETTTWGIYCMISVINFICICIT